MFQMDQTNRSFCTQAILGSLRKQATILYIVVIVFFTTMLLVHFMDITFYILRGSIQIKNNMRSPRDENSTSLYTLKYRNHTTDINRDILDKNQFMKYSIKKYSSTTENLSMNMSTVSSKIKSSVFEYVINRTVYYQTGTTTLHQNQQKQRSRKIIIDYLPPWYEGYRKRLTFEKCLYSDCALTEDRTLLNESAALLINDKMLSPLRVPDKLDKQIWILHTDESPVHMEWRKRSPALDNMFDYTMCYRKDCNFSLPFGKIISKRNPVSINYDDVFQRKTKDVAWFSSNCRTPSLRRFYADELQKYIPVDWYGGCGRKKCGTSIILKNDDCHLRISREYKFYLSFENSLCEDYTTEKLYHIFQHQMPIVPVVRGAPNVKNYIPNGTYIDTHDFKSAKELAEFLKEVGGDKAKYTGYLKRMSMFTSVSHEESFQRSMCDICELLNKPFRNLYPLNIPAWLRASSCVHDSRIRDW